MIKVTRAEKSQFSREALGRIERMREDFKRLNGLPERERRELVNAIFRDMHSLKGAAQAQGQRSISTLAHKTEDLLDALRSGGAAPSDRESALFFASLDMLRSIVDSLHLANLIDVSPLIALLDNVVAERSGRERTDKRLGG